MHRKPSLRGRARLPSTWMLGLFLLLATLTWTSVLANSAPHLGEHGFDWTTVEQDRAHFRWTAVVVNDSAQEFTVQVTVDLLDDDDAVVASDSTSTTIGGSAQARVEHDASLPFERAADVVSLRFRLASLPPEGR